MYLFLINPEAGNKKFQSVEGRMRQLLDSLSIKYKFVTIPDLTDVPTLLQENLSPKLTGVVAVGGNATVNAVINSLVGEDLPLAIVPMSRTNFLAHSLGITRWDQAVKMLANPDTHSERLGKVGNQYFVNKIEVLSHANLISRNVKRTTLLTSFLGLGNDAKNSDHGLHTTVTIDDEIVIKGPVNRIEAELSPEKETKKLRLTLVTGHGNKTDITKLPANGFVVECDRKMAVVMGNETIGQTPAEVKGLAKYINILVPQPVRKLTSKK